MRVDRVNNVVETFGNRLAERDGYFIRTATAEPMATSGHSLPDGRTRTVIHESASPLRL